mmetsp:Transcript_4361/g.6285  ORF Transcript_4361/g.6285 Transcript_4361/m.6285 type:complete len:124 (-) Transcript_4361:216-587(-)|eukprot:CAMPEP_0194200668 /NCGR_PEP_ID=MMETSP0156-20130528/1174_1 /TAXON_ID=33649 /ORGANISM="Thalassionema nitzschioides, Strain L26-B" /LENGTH=123 /DNA_ID=CAMNT_0038925697 /DNA_START=59 /DNA_END=430 /DNA_ORIENTATION=+
MSSSAIEQQCQDPRFEEDEKLLELCIEHEPFSWTTFLNSASSTPTKIRKVDSNMPIEQQWMEEDEMLLQVCIQYDPWSNFFAFSKDTARKLLKDKSTTSAVGTLRRVSSVGSLRRVHSRTQLA